MSLLNTVDITAEIPFSLWLAGGAVFVLIIFLGNRLLSKLFLPKSEDEEAPIWKAKDEKRK